MPDKTNSSVNVQIVSWNSLTHLPTCLEAVVKQTHAGVQVMIVDNASADGTLQWLSEQYPHLHILRNTRNLGFSRAHNQALLIGDSQFVLVLNPDVVLAPDWIARGVAWLEMHPEVGAFGGKLRRYTYTSDELKEVAISDIIDSAGLRGNRSRHFVDRGSGQKDAGQWNQAEAVFGISGACVLLRKSALETIRFKDEYFDENFFAYKDDIDLAWRLQRMGWQTWYDPGALAWHHRQATGHDRYQSLALARNHRRHLQRVATASYRNHWWLLAKNESWASLWRDLPWVAWYELRKFVFFLFTQPAVLSSLNQVRRGWPVMRRKGLLLRRRQKQPAAKVRAWFLTS